MGSSKTESGNLENKEAVAIEQSGFDDSLDDGFNAPPAKNLVPVGYNADKSVNSNNPPDKGDMPFGSTEQEIEEHVDAPAYAPHFSDHLPFGDTPVDRGRRSQEEVDAEDQAVADAKAEADAKAASKASKAVRKDKSDK